MNCPDRKTLCKRDSAFEFEQKIPTGPEELGLTQRQSSVLALLMEGLPNKAIAERLGLTENTIKDHVSGILKRFGLRTRVQVIAQMNRLRVHEIVGAPDAHPDRKAFHENDPSLTLDPKIPVAPEELGLTKRQGLVLGFMLQGLSNEGIALRLGLARETVKKHVSQIFGRLGASTRAEVILQMKHLCVRDAESKEGGGKRSKTNG
jgi:DNA-binding NarL/FixJ family response regulator